MQRICRNLVPVQGAGPTLTWVRPAWGIGLKMSEAWNPRIFVVAPCNVHIMRCSLFFFTLQVGNFAAGPYRDDQERTHWGFLVFFNIEHHWTDLLWRFKRCRRCWQVAQCYLLAFVNCLYLLPTAGIHLRLWSIVSSPLILGFVPVSVQNIHHTI